MQTINGVFCSNQGNARKRNEDTSYFFQNIMPSEETEKSYLTEKSCNGEGVCAIFDGMGGTVYGKEASLYAAKILKEKEGILLKAGISEKEKVLMQVIFDINDGIWELCKQKGDMGTTIALLYIAENKIYAINVGDSLIFRVKDKKMEQISKRHNLAQFLLDSDMISQDQYERHPGKYQLTQYLGVNKNEMIIEPYIYELAEDELLKEEEFLICSDGLLDSMSKEEIEYILKKQNNLKETINEMVQRALEKDGKDNITAMLIEIKRNVT